ncbi:MAG: IMP dehydrogenase [Algibacter sp.]
MRYIGDIKKLVPEGIVGRVRYKGELNVFINLLVVYVQVWTIAELKDIDTLKETGQFVKITASGINESHLHDVTIIKEPPNYSR